MVLLIGWARRVHRCDGGVRNRTPRILDFPPERLTGFPMNVVIAPDKFKGSLTNAQVIEAIKAGLADSVPGSRTHEVVASDGGDGFLASIRRYVPGVVEMMGETVDSLGRPMQGTYLIDSGNQTAFVELADASGLVNLTEEERNPLMTSTLGTGLQLKDAVSQGARNIYVGLGGSATNDGGIGMASALGYEFLDRQGDALQPRAIHLKSLDRIDVSNVMAGWRETAFVAINDVNNPLTGPEGASAVYGPQKGADAAMVAELDRGLQHLEAIVRRDLGKKEGATPGAGAAGGAGYGLRVFCDAAFLSGIDFILSLSGIEPLLERGDIDCIITGEGKIDDQTAYGKLVSGIANAGRRHGVPVMAVCGQLALDKRSPDELGLSRVVEIHEEGRPVEETMARAAELVSRATATLVREAMTSSP